MCIRDRDNGSMFNTPPTYAIYIAGLVFKNLKRLGGIGEMEKINREKAAMLYDFLDNSSLFSATVAGADRSMMNVPFVTGDAELDREFVAEAKKAGLVNLKGHRSVGGMRASIYNAMPEDGVRSLIAFMEMCIRDRYIPVPRNSRSRVPAAHAEYRPGGSCCLQSRPYAL